MTKFHRDCTTLVFFFIAASNAVSQGTFFSWDEPNLKLGQERPITVEYYNGRLAWKSSALDSLNLFLQANPDLVIEIGVHSDSRGADELNLILAKSRSSSARNYLVEFGVIPDQVVSKGYGESQLIIPDDSIRRLSTRQMKEAAHQLNRRTIVKIIALRRSCEIERVLLTVDHLDALTERDLFYFFRTYSPSCLENVEFMEFSNETLFAGLHARPEAFVEALDSPELLEDQRVMILKELSQPVHDGLSLEIPPILSDTTDHKLIRSKIISALQAAVGKQ